MRNLFFILISFIFYQTHCSELQTQNIIDNEDFFYTAHTLLKTTPVHAVKKAFCNKDNLLHVLLFMKNADNNLLCLPLEPSIRGLLYPINPPLIHSKPYAFTIKNNMKFIAGDNKIFYINNDGTEIKYIPYSHEINDMDIYERGEKDYTLVTADEKKIILWNIEEGRQFFHIAHHTKPINKILVYGNILFSCSDDGTLVQMDLRHNKKDLISQTTKKMSTFSFNSDTNTIATATDSGILTLIDLAKREKCFEIQGTNPIKKIVNNERWLFFLLKDSNFIYYYDTERKIINKFDNNKIINDFVCTNGNNQIVLAESTGIITLWEKMIPTLGH